MYVHYLDTQYSPGFISVYSFMTHDDGCLRTMHHIGMKIINFYEAESFEIS